MSRPIIVLFASSVLLFAAAVSLAASRSVAPTQGDASPPTAIEGAPGSVVAAPTSETAARTPIFGPIRSRDPRVRAEIKRLYVAQSDLLEEARARVRDLAEEIRTEADPDLRQTLRREVADVKHDAQRRHMEAGLEIARLNEDPARVAEFEKALDQLLNPKRPTADAASRPAPRPRPEAAARNAGGER